MTPRERLASQLLSVYAETTPEQWCTIMYQSGDMYCALGHLGFEAKPVWEGNNAHKRELLRIMLGFDLAQINDDNNQYVAQKDPLARERVCNALLDVLEKKR